MSREQQLKQHRERNEGCRPSCLHPFAFRGVGRDESDDAFSYARRAVATINHALVEPAVANGSAGDSRRSNPPARGVCLNGGDDLISVHAPIRDNYPLTVKRDNRPLCVLYGRG